MDQILHDDKTLVYCVPDFLKPMCLYDGLCPHVLYLSSSVPVPRVESQFAHLYCTFVTSSGTFLLNAYEKEAYAQCRWDLQAPQERLKWGK